MHMDGCHRSRETLHNFLQTSLLRSRRHIGSVIPCKIHHVGKAQMRSCLPQCHINYPQIHRDKRIGNGPEAPLHLCLIHHTLHRVSMDPVRTRHHQHIPALYPLKYIHKKQRQPTCAPRVPFVTVHAEFAASHSSSELSQDSAVTSQFSPPKPVRQLHE